MKYIETFESFLGEASWSESDLKDKSRSEILRLISSAFYRANKLNGKILIAKKEKRSDLVNILKSQFAESNKEYKKLTSFGKKNHEITDTEIKDEISKKNESIDFTNEGKHNSEVLELVDSIHSVINKIKTDSSIPKEKRDKLFTLAGPLVKALHDIVD